MIWLHGLIKCRTELEVKYDTERLMILLGFLLLEVKVLRGTESNLQGVLEFPEVRDLAADSSNKTNCIQHVKGF